MMLYRKIFKRLIDCVIAIVVLTLTLPFLVFCVITLTLFNRGTPFFIQKRPGKNGKLFRIIKFKTMNDKRDSSGNLLPDEYRLTGIGKFIRKSSIDELPQLFNVLIGQMSLIGPRPLLPEYLGRYSPFQARRHEVHPGITGWAQVNGRNAISWEQRFELDVWYVDNLSFRLDMKIIYKTVIKVLKSEGISDGQSSTMTKFDSRS